MSRKPAVEHVDIDLDDMRRRVASSALSDEDRAMFHAVLDTLALVTRELESKRCSVVRLRRLVFGAKTEKLSSLESNAKLEGDADGDELESNSESDDSENSSSNGEQNSGSKDPSERSRADTPRQPKGHGRHGAADYTGATQRDVPHSSLNHGDPCPLSCGGKVYDVDPMRLVRLHGGAPISAECVHLGQLRCGLCGEVFTADVPDDVKDEKYDETAMAIVTLLKYGTGFPFSRLARLQLSTGVPLAASTQWQLCEKAGRWLAPAFLALVDYAAQGGLLYVDDTGAKILGLVRRHGESREQAAQRQQWLDSQARLNLPVPPERLEGRTGTFTTGIVSTIDEHTVVLYQTGWRHAGDNLEHLLARRHAELPTPIQMCDALNRNASGDFQTILANCLAHARREFADLVSLFKEPCLHVIRQIAQVYHSDDEARKQGLSPEERLAWHQQHSGPVMDALAEWMKTEIAERRIEPNGPLGSAIKYMQKHWSKLTLFLHVAGAPLDNNLCERILKRAILHRKNSLFFRTARGASVADICMSLIQTAELAKQDPLHYLTTLLQHHQQVADSPGRWLPWNYQQTVAELEAAAA
jgi:transposase